MTRMTREQFGVQAGDSIIVRGTVAFARIDKPIDGEELQKENQRRATKGMKAATRPYRSLSIENPSVVAGMGTPLAQYHESRYYQNGKTGIQTMSMENKSLFPPSYGHLQNNVIVPMEDPQKNPAVGQEVYLYITAYGGKGTNMSSSFDSILFGPGEIKYYTGGANSLEGFGQMLNLPVQAQTQAPAANAYDQQTAGQPQTQENTFAQAPVSEPNPFGQQTQASQPNPFGQQAPASQPNQFEQPAQTAQPNPFGQQATQPNPFGQQAPASQQNPFGQAPQNDFNGQQANAQQNPFAQTQAGQPQQNPFGQAPQNAGQPQGNPFNPQG